MHPLLAEASHQAGLIPLAGLFCLLVSGRRPNLFHWWLAFGFAISWPADSETFFKDGSWEVWYYFVPFQMWVIASAFMKSNGDRLISFFAFPALGVVSWGLTAPGLEQLVTISGSVLILMLARKSGLIFWPFFIYFGAGTMAYVFMANSAPHEMTAPMYVFQSCRLCAYIAFIAITAPPLARKRGAIL